MSFLRMLAIAFIFISTTVAWIILGTVTQVRSEEYSTDLNSRVKDLCGSELAQKVPGFTAITPLRQTVPDFKGKTSKTVGFWNKKTLVTEKRLTPSANNIDVDLELEYRRKGLLWFPVYKCRFSGEYVLQNTTKYDMKVRTHFEFPSPVATYDEFKLEVDGKVRDCQVDTDKGVKLDFVIKPESKRVFRVAYHTRGVNSWRYLPKNPGDGRLRDFTMKVKTNFKAIDFADSSLSPTSLESSNDGCRMQWKANNLITSKPIAVTMPERLNPGPLVAKVTFFAPVCLLFFFVVLLAVNILVKVDIHPMHFMFTAAGFFAFNLLFAYLVDVINVHVSFLIASIVTLVLVISYQRAALGEKFPYKWVGVAQFCYLVLFSYSFFFKGLTGLTVTIGSIITLAVLMYLTRRIDWNQTFSKKQKRIKAGCDYEAKNTNS